MKCVAWQKMCIKSRWRTTIGCKNLQKLLSSSWKECRPQTFGSSLGGYIFSSMCKCTSSDSRVKYHGRLRIIKNHHHDENFIFYRIEWSFNVDLSRYMPICFFTMDSRYVCQW